jgi:hypothetical protein
MQRGYKEDNGSKNNSVGMESLFREDLIPEAANVRSRYQENPREGTAGWKKQRDFVKCGNSDYVTVVCSYDL